MPGKKVTLQSDNAKGACPGMVFNEDSKSQKGLVVIQEWWGMNEQIQEEAEEIGKEGNFVTIVPDLYRGKVATDHEEAQHEMESLDWQGAVTDIQAAILYLKRSGCKKVGVTGFCMGGALSLAAGALLQEADAVAPFYGIPSTELCDVSKIKCPVQCHFGEKDHIEGFSAPKDAEALKEKLKAGNVNFEFYMYPCGHAFTNPTGPLENYDKENCQLAMKRLYEFMNNKLS